MKTEAWDFLKHGRIDRFDLLLHKDADAWQVLYPRMDEMFVELARSSQVPITRNHRCLGANTVNGKRLYSYETWGEASDVWAKAIGPDQWSNLHRLDFRFECDVDVEKLAGLVHHVERVGKFGRNVQYFSTREREKKEGRHAGGKGVSIGSHKSDRRLVIYKKKGERGAVELQLSGGLLVRMVGIAKELVEKRPGLSMYDAMIELMVPAIEKMARESGFESLYALVMSASLQGTLEPPADFVVEAPEQMILQGFEQLPAEAKSRVMRALIDKQLP